jgi:patatin-like phospholipase/acyl hydrolase
MKRLLNIDGGGIRIYFSLLILKYIEEKTNKKIIDIFDYFAGVSASSIVLAGLLTRYSVDDMITTFKDIAKKIFYRSYYYSITSGFGMFDSKYPDYYINEEFKKVFEDMKLSDVKKPFSILAYDLETNKPVSFHSYMSTPCTCTPNNDYKLWELVRSSTAAPTYFPPYVLDKYTLIDGGVVTNNLSEYIFINALEHFGKDEEYYQLSIGTGTYIRKFETLPGGLWSWSGSIMDVLFSATSNYEMNTLNKISHFERLKKYDRVDIELIEPIVLDDYSSFDKMDTIFNMWINIYHTDLDKICSEL